MPRFSSSQSKRQGRISVSGDTLWITFPFNKKRFERIKRLPSAVYNKRQRRWELPLLELPAIRSIEHFRPEEIVYDLDEQAAARLNELQQQRSSAAERWKCDPFCVAAADIALIDPDVVIEHTAGKGIRVRLRRYSKAKRFVEKIPGAHYISREGCWYVPVDSLAELLKTLRDNTLTFAVEQQAGRLLKDSAGLRARSAAGEELSGEELKRALLAPYADVHGVRPAAVLHGLTNEQLKRCFPKLNSYAERRRSAAECSERQLAEALYYGAQSGVRLALSAALRQRMSVRAAQFGEQYSGRCSHAAAAVFQFDRAWLQASDGSGALYLSDELYAKYRRIIAKAPGKPAVSRLATGLTSGWLCAAADYQLPEFVAWAGDNLDAAVALRSTEFEQQIAACQAQAARRAQQRRFLNMSDAALPGLREELAEMLYPHQRVAVAWLLENQEAFLGDDMGLGKTLSVLALYTMLVEQHEADFMLVVCPNSLVRNWQREAQQWTPERKLAALPPSKPKRQEFLRKLEYYDRDWIRGLVVNFETLRLKDVFPVLSKICAGRRTLLCVDESQRAKNPQSKTFLALAEISAVCRRRVLLSGTPTPRDITDIWAQMRILDGGERLGLNYYRWLEEVAELGTKWSEFAVKKFRKEAVEESINRVQEVLLRRRKEEVLSLPEKIFTVRDVEMKGDQKKRYDEVRKALLLRVSTTDGKTYIREIDSILEEFLRAVQIASNPRLIDETWSGEPAKFLELDEIVREVVAERGEKIVIWTNYRRNAAELSERYRRFGAEAFTGETTPDQRAELIERFQASEDMKIMLAIPAAGGVGITLTAAQTAVYLEKTWNAEHWLQSVDRLHRIGQRGTVHILSLHGSLVDDIIYKNLRRKQVDQARLLGDTEPHARLAPSRTELLEAVQG